MKRGLERIGWTSEVAEKLKGVVSGSKVSHMLKDCVWREVRKEWLSEANERSKLRVLQALWEQSQADGLGCQERTEFAHNVTQERWKM